MLSPGPWRGLRPWASGLRTGVMGRFLKENWIWIVAPVVTVIVVVAVILIMSEGDPSADFVYNLR